MGGGGIAATRPTLSSQHDPHYQHHLKHNLSATLPVPLCVIQRRYMYWCLHPLSTSTVYIDCLHRLSTSTPVCSVYIDSCLQCLHRLLSAVSTSTPVCISSCLHPLLSASTPVCHTHHQPLAKGPSQPTGSGDRACMLIDALVDRHAC